MYLKALEIQGFKSFPEKTRLTFEKAVTGIVGPNGSGKSNIADAILWVLGEQSTRALRGGKMEDVIFGGTAKRGQVGFAEVSLILDNTSRIVDMEHTEVMITRRYYRSGESEYFINRQPVRLRDVNELFMDTGLGREGYSIISQGKIDDILSAKSTDRRDIFEEAAGISRFRHRKEESERKLQKTDENLVRINDKISELELQVEPLREQAETAKKYLVLRDELRSLEISVWTDNLETIAKRTEKLTADHEAAKVQFETASRDLDELYQRSETFADQMHDKDREADNVRESISLSESKISECESGVAVLQANLQNNIGDIERIRQELSDQESRDGGIKAQIDERNERIASVQSSKDDLAGVISELIGKSEQLSKNAGESAAHLTQLFQKDNEITAAAGDSRAELSALAASAQELLDRESGVKAEISEALDRLSQWKEDLTACGKELTETLESKNALQNVISGYVMRAESRRQKFQAAQDKKVKMTMDLNALKSRINLLTEMEKDYQGYSKSVKIVMQEASRGVLKRIHGPVADLVKTDEPYSLAIETAFGGSMQHVVVESDEDGKAAINLLKRRDGGRATFLPLSTIRGTELREKGLAEEEGFEGLALELVRFDEKYRGIYTNLLGRIAVVDQMDSAIRIARKYGYRFRIVTLDGQVINAGGSMTGGSTARNAGILSRANELKALSEQEGILAENLKKAEREAEDAQRELSAAEYELNVSREEMRAAEDQQLKLESARAHLQHIVDEAEKAAASLQAESKSLKERIEKNSTDIEETRRVIIELEKLSSTLKQEIEEQTAGQENLVRAREEILEQTAGVRAQLASYEAECDALRKSVSELTALRDDLSGGRESQLQLLENLKLRNTEIQAEIEAKEKDAAETAAQIDGLKKRISEIASEKLQLEAQRTNRERETQEKNRELLDLERECARLEQKKLAASMEEKQIVDKLWDTYELSRSTAAEIRQQLDSVTEASRRIAGIKREISKLGNPNIGAIDEFERVNTRYTFLTGQRDDIEEAKNELTGIIGAITAEMREIFAREFDVINKSFRETFVELFSGGTASLELEDPDDILNCGIEIHVQPPGKSLKTLTLLSGGEKAFVAIALYFAILKVRPTPFVVMDEIEAALDEANVLRFAEYMRRMSDKTQIIVITHHRGTMEESDVLYGVTMQEQGVSRILNVDLEEAEKAIIS